MQLDRILITVTTKLSWNELDTKLEEWVDYQEIATLEDFSIVPIEQTNELSTFEIMFTFHNGIEPQDVGNFAVGVGAFVEVR